MAYRFTNTDKWNDSWFSELKPLAKLLFMYLCDQCDIAGFLELNVKKITFDLGCDKQGMEKAMKEIGDRLAWSEDGRFIYVKNFLKHQRNLPLSDHNKAHIPIKRIINENIDKFKISSIDALLQGGYKGDVSPYGNGNGNSNGNKGGMGEKEDTPTWRNSFEVYRKQAHEAAISLYRDSNFISERQKYHPNIDIRLTIEKCYKDFWGLEAGWANKKKSKTKDIDWKRTYVNAISMRTNQVFKNSKQADEPKREERIPKALQ